MSARLPEGAWSGRGSARQAARMVTILRRCSGVLAAATVLAAAGAIIPAVANAQPVAAGSVTMNSDEGDFIGGGQSYAFSPQHLDSFTVSASEAGTTVVLSVHTADGDFWDFDFAAPAAAPLAPGRYDNATRYPFQSPLAPGLSVSGAARGCNTLTGSFTVAEATIIQGYVQVFDATFEQHCEGFTAALRGHVRITNPPPPPPLAVTTAIDGTGTASTLTGRATVHGTITCTQSVPVNVSGKVTQVVQQRIVRGTFNTSVGCVVGSAAAWRGIADPTGDIPFRQGNAFVELTVSAFDQTTGRNVISTPSATVWLRSTSAPQVRVPHPAAA